MSDWKVSIAEVQSVLTHPKSDKLSVICLLDNPFAFNIIQVVSAKLEDGSHRYKETDLVVFVPDKSIVPDYLLKQGFWDEEKNKGVLAGPDGNRVKAGNFKGVRSEGILFPVNQFQDEFFVLREELESSVPKSVNHGDNIANFLGITEWENK